MATTLIEAPPDNVQLSIIAAISEDGIHHSTVVPRNYRSMHIKQCGKNTKIDHRHSDTLIFFENFFTTLTITERSHSSIENLPSLLSSTTGQLSISQMSSSLPTLSKDPPRACHPVSAQIASYDKSPVQKMFDIKLADLLKNEAIQCHSLASHAAREERGILRNVGDGATDCSRGRMSPHPALMASGPVELDQPEQHVQQQCPHAPVQPHMPTFFPPRMAKMTFSTIICRPSSSTTCLCSKCKKFGNGDGDGSES
ncbi:hypothetical protein BLNAU_3661 [Blattamonas nauphoetae]|uniref:Uncharacterized protein n=1 Tax=Blattamonas nauphoetae TaxID=2049346 RepID=A0ABQ9YBW4_9EUKA|nr:hypothetical protein BLNAU_3661 [Blattamonas nauphoetae]